MANKVHTIAYRLARLLSSLNALLTLLTIYLSLIIITYLLIKFSLGPGSAAEFITYETATGGDPFNFGQQFINHPLLWHWLLFIHIISWLIVPVLTATAVDIVFHVWERKRIQLDQQIENNMIQALIINTRLSPEEAEGFVRLWRQMMSKVFKDDIKE
jgi:hypothetical protein